MTWQNCDDCGATLLVTIPYDGRSLCHACWEDAKSDGRGTGGPMGDNQAGDEPTTVTVSVDLFDQAPMHTISPKWCNSCGTSIANGGNRCPSCGKMLRMRRALKPQQEGAAP